NYNGLVNHTDSAPKHQRMLSMRLLIKEHTMKRQWQIRRQFQTTADAARRWDQAYQMLLQWSQSTASTTKPDLATTLHSPLEVTLDSTDCVTGSVRPRLPTSGARVRIAWHVTTCIRWCCLKNASILGVRSTCSTNP